MIPWRERIVAARKRGHFTPTEVNLAGDWDTCAVGEQAASHPLVVRFRNGVAQCGPVDLTLLRLGDAVSGFAAAVATDDFFRAEILLDRIEDRALVLKQEAA